VNQQPTPTTHNQQLHPWQFFVLAGLGCATAATFMARGRGITAVVMLSVLMAGAAVIGMAALRALRPLVSPDEDRTAMLGQRTRAALERDKLLALRAIKELEFDRAMGKLSEEDFKEMSGRLRGKAARLMRQLDAGAGYREQIERDLAKKIEERSTKASEVVRSAKASEVVRSAKASEVVRSAKASAERVCPSCDARNDDDARFCKSCGARL
jgi:zinc-ribbon domain